MERRGSSRLDDHGARACARVAPGVGCDVVYRVRCDLRRIDQDVSGQNTIDESAVGQVVALVVINDCAKVGVDIADVNYRGIVALDADRWGSGRSGNPPSGSERSEAVISIQLGHSSHQVIQRPRC
jgi:hypothetical protein